MPIAAIISEKLTTEPNDYSIYDRAIVGPTFEPTTSIPTVVPKPRLTPRHQMLIQSSAR